MLKLLSLSLLLSLLAVWCAPGAFDPVTLEGKFIRLESLVFSDGDFALSS